MPKSRIRQLLSFSRAFGVSSGVRLWCSLLIQQRVLMRDTVALRVPGTAAPVYLRKRDLPIFWQIMVIQEYEVKSFPQAHRVLEMYDAFRSEGKKPIIIDCGGHVGLSAIWFATRFPDALVYVVEPDESNFRLLKRNTAAYSQVKPLYGGVWGQACRLKISNPSAGNASFRLSEATESPDGLRDSLRGYSIDGIGGPDGLQALLAVKIDIEGAEAAVFQQPSEWLRRAKLVIIELHDWLLPWQGTSRNLFRRLGEHNFDVVIKGENLLLFQP